MKKGLILIVFSLCFMRAYSQPPGYLGKHFMVGYDLNAVPNFSESVFSESHNLPFRIYLSHQFNLDYVIGRQTVIGMEYETIAQNRALLDGAAGGQANAFYSGSFYCVRSLFYLHDEIAPVGSYFELKGGAGSISEFNSSTSDVSQDMASIAKLSLGFGQSHVLFNRLTYNYGMDLNLYFGVGGDIKRYKSFQIFNNSNSDCYSFMWSKYMLTYKIGIGALLF